MANKKGKPKDDYPGKHKKLQYLLIFNFISIRL